jgi:hypothetical protein
LGKAAALRYDTARLSNASYAQAAAVLNQAPLLLTGSKGALYLRVLTACENTALGGSFGGILFEVLEAVQHPLSGIYTL